MWGVVVVVSFGFVVVVVVVLGMVLVVVVVIVLVPFSSLVCGLAHVRRMVLWCLHYTKPSLRMGSLRTWVSLAVAGR